MEPQPSTPPTGTNYDFIMNPQKPAKRKMGVGGDSFIFKILFIVGGAIIVMIVLAVVINLFFGGRTNVESLVTLAQDQQEITRLGELGDDATSRDVKNAAVNTTLSLKSQQGELLTYLGKRGREVKKEELALKEDSSADKRLETAKQASLFDSTYTNLMRTELTDYATALKSTYDGTTNAQQRDLLKKHYAGVQLLLKQWPPASVGFNR